MRSFLLDSKVYQVLFDAHFFQSLNSSFCGAHFILGFYPDFPNIYVEAGANDAKVRISMDMLPTW